MNIFPGVGHLATGEGSIGLTGGVTVGTPDAEADADGAGLELTVAPADADSDGIALAVAVALAEADSDGITLELADAAVETDGAGAFEAAGSGSNGAEHEPNPVFVIESSAPEPEILIPDSIGLSFPGTRPMLMTKFPPLWLEVVVTT